MQVTICIEADAAGDQALVEAWFARWRDTLAFCSPNEGCGCCVDIWNVDAPVPALRELPEHVFAMSEWAEEWLRDPSPGTVDDRAGRGDGGDPTQA